ncbi:MAG: HEAT repeat domain-containing protein [Actinomycetota bacterium]|nr:HEAT repeat domain-containing protein [Actinomycetota bacterium]
MELGAQHELVRTTEDRSWTFALLDAVRSASTSASERDEAFRTLAFLEDYRSVTPLTSMVEDGSLPEPVRDAASAVVAAFDDSTTGERRRAWWDSGDRVERAHALRLMDRSDADIVVAVAGDDQHPAQALALTAMSFGFDEPKYQPIKIRALGHPDADVRRVAADVLLWNEAVAAEGPLVSAASDPDSDVATAAVDALQYYPSRRALRALAHLTEAGDEQVRGQVAESFGYSRSRFEELAASRDSGRVAFLREWMRPVADLIRRPGEVPDQEVPPPPTGWSPLVMSESELLALLLDPDGKWAPKKRAFHEVAWEEYSASAQERLSAELTECPDPVVRESATAPLAAWARSAELLALTSDPSFSVRKSAIYHLASLPRDPTVARVAWDYMLDAGATTASEALRTYVAHASAGEAKERLMELALTDRRESIQATAISCLVGLGAAGELESLTAVLNDPPGVTWARHIAVIDGLRALPLPEPELDHLTGVDNLDLIQSIVSLRCSSHQ